MCIENLMCIALGVPETIAIGVLVGVVNPNLGEEAVVGGRGRQTLRYLAGLCQFLRIFRKVKFLLS